MNGISGFLFALAAASLLVIELGLAAIGFVLAGEFIHAMWRRSALQGVLASLLFAGVAWAWCGHGVTSAWRPAIAASTAVPP